MDWMKFWRPACAMRHFCAWIELCFWRICLGDVTLEVNCPIMLFLVFEDASSLSLVVEEEDLWRSSCG